jgi:small subunit ribosomal protein S16
VSRPYRQTRLGTGYNKQFSWTVRAPTLFTVRVQPCKHNLETMVKIRLRRIGTKGRPFYRVVVAKSSAGRNGAFVETIGTYDPVVKPTLININEERALHWLMNGAQPSETTAILLNKVGILPKYFEARPSAKKSFKFLDKRTAAISLPTTIEAPKAEAAPEPAPAPAPEPTPEPEVVTAPEPETEVAVEPADAAPAEE